MKMLVAGGGEGASLWWLSIFIICTFGRGFD